MTGQSFFKAGCKKQGGPGNGGIEEWSGEAMITQNILNE